MKAPNMIRLLETFIYTFALALAWRSASAMIASDISAEPIGFLQSLWTFAIPVVMLAAIVSFTVFQTKAHTWRKIHNSIRDIQPSTTDDLLRFNIENTEIIKNLNKQLTELYQENFRLNSMLQERNRRLMQDTLTGVSNRLAYEERLQQEFKRWNRFNNPLTFLIWDIDHFKKINDQYGHAIGDKVLCDVAKQLSNRIRGTDFLARFGGEEFVMLLPGADIEAASQLADQIRISIAESGLRNAKTHIPITISCGLASFQPGDSVQNVFERADRALYQSKQAGRNRCTAG